MVGGNSGRNESSKYDVVCFLPRRYDGLDEIDLVPYFWLDFVDSKLMCAYPNNKKDFKKREKYLENLTPPKTSWSLWEVEIISTTGKLLIIHYDLVNHYPIATLNPHGLFFFIVVEFSILYNYKISF